MPKIRKQTYTMSMLMEYIKDKDIRDDADVQRASGQWTNEQINELIVTVLNDGYIPPIFIGEDLNSQKWLVDGLQRSTSLNMYRYGNYRISPAIRNSVINYRTKRKDDTGNIVVDARGDILWEDACFDIKNTTYEELPNELKKQFDSFQLDTVIFEECTMEKMSKLIQIYNNHTSMNTSQKAFTYVSNFAHDIREILESPFFVEYSSYTEKEKIRGVTERVVLESVMCIFHLKDWKKQIKQIGIYLSQNASKEEFYKLNEYLHRLERVITEDVKDIFDSKNSFLFLTLFSRFTDYGIEDIRFIDFLRAFKNRLRYVKVDGMLFDEVDRRKGTKDKSVIISKLHILERLMRQYLHVDKLNKRINVKRFISENTGIKEEIVARDLDIYSDTLDDLEERTIPVGSVLRNEDNRASLLAMVAYSYKEDEDLDDWLEGYAKRNPAYVSDQKRNYLHMREDFMRFAGLQT